MSINLDEIAARAAQANLIKEIIDDYQNEAPDESMAIIANELELAGLAPALAADVDALLREVEVRDKALYTSLDKYDGCGICAYRNTLNCSDDVDCTVGKVEYAIDQARRELGEEVTADAE